MLTMTSASNATETSAIASAREGSAMSNARPIDKSRLALPDPDRCRKCAGDSRVIETRRASGYLRRRHECNGCGHRWNSYQTLINPKRLIAVRKPA